MTGYWVVFNEKGDAARFSGSEFEGAVWVEGVDDATLIACRLVDGEWIEREPVLEPDVSPEPEPVPDASERRRAIDAEVFRRAGPDILLRSMGRITIAQLTAREATIRAEVEAEFAAGGGA